MDMGAFFPKSETLRIDEAKQKLPGVPSKRRIRAIEFHFDPYSPKAPKKRPKPDIEAINALLAKLPEPDGVELFSIGYDSNLTHVPEIGRFKNIRHLHVASAKVRHYDPMYRFNRLETLFLVGYKEQDLSKFKGLRTDFFRAIRGDLAHIDASMTEGQFQSCSKLESLDGAKARKIDLDACKSIDHDTLAGVKGLRCLVLRTSSATPLTSMAFVPGCKQLEYLSLAGAHFNGIDYSALTQSKSLKYLVTVVKGRLLREIAEANPRKLVYNDDLCLKGKRELEDFPADEDDYGCDFHKARAGAGR